jgi:DNA mismatch repair protein MutS
MFARISVVQLRRDRNLCYTSFLEQKGTVLEIIEGTHLLIHNGVRNDIHLTNSGCMITGPNAAGKSTFLKSILLNILLSQSLGICCATICNMTPFYFINSQINIPDTKGIESLFEAEMHRCKYNLDVIKELPKDRKSVVVMDELFNSTNVIEGISGAYAILSKLSTFENTMTLLTTHFPYLTKLKTFSRFKFDATILTEKNKSDEAVKKIYYNYKIQPGVSKQYIALDILKNKFDPDIIEIAQRIKEKLLV